MASLILLHIIGSVCLMLFGLKLIRNGIMRAFGSGMRKVLTISTQNRLLAFCAGIGITALLQSSTATAMMIASFAGQGMISTTAGLAIILGADLGTTLVAQFLAFDVSWLAPVAIVAGYIFYSGRNQSGPSHQLGRILVGFGLILLSLTLIKTAAAPLNASETLPLILKPMDTDPMLALLVGLILTWIFHSSLAMVLLLMSMVHADLIPVHLALVMVLGANIGNVIPRLLAALKEPPASARISCGNLIIRLIGVLVALFFVDKIPALMESFSGNDARLVVHFHMIFNLILAIVFLPLLDLIARLVKYAVPEREDVNDVSKPHYLDDEALETPSVALTNAARESLRIADFLEQMLQLTWNTFQKRNLVLLDRVRALDNTIDTLYRAIKNHLVQMGSHAMNAQEAKRHFQILTFATNIEHVGDIIDKSLLQLSEKKIKGGSDFSPQGFIELNNLFRLVLDSVRLAQTVFISGDVKLAQQLVEDKAAIKQAELQASINHMSRMQQGIPETLATSDLHMDIIRDLRRINSLMASIAYPILEESNEQKKLQQEALQSTT